MGLMRLGLAFDWRKVQTGSVTDGNVITQLISEAVTILLSLFRFELPP